MNAEDFKKMTVADLRKELKARNLPVAGNKSDLMQRLTEHILNSEEGQLLDTSANVDESLLEGIHEDEVLGLSSNASLSSLNSPRPVHKSATPAKEPTNKPAVATKAAAKQNVVVEGKQTAGDNSDESADGNGQQGQSKVVDASEPHAPKKIHLKTSSTDAETKSDVESKKLVPADPDEARIERAKKFNLPLSDNDRKKLRAERFGLSSSASASKSAASIVSSVPLDPDVLMKRAQRFGVPVVKTSKNISTGGSGDTGKLKERAERFGLDKKSEQPSKATGDGETTNGGAAGNEALLKRKQRFAGVGGEADQKKKARSERFAL